MSADRFIAILSKCLLSIALLVISGCGGSGGHSITSGVTLTPSLTNVSVAPGQLISLKVSVSGTSNSALKWMVKETNGGTVTPDGVFTAPNRVIVSHVIVTSIADPSKSVTFTINVTDRRYRWTVLVYMAADNDLESTAIDNFNAMEQLGSTGDVKVLIQFKRSPLYDSSNGDWAGARRYEVSKDTDPQIINSSVIRDLGNVDMGNAATLSDFIAWGQSYAPAEHYLLVLWDHGNGWDSVDDKPSSRAIGSDDTFNSMIKIVDLPNALSVGQKLDIVACDACLMSQMEVLYELRNCADYFVGSEEESPIEGFAYDHILGKLASTGDSEPRDIARFIAEDSYKHWSGWPSATCSAVDLSRVNDVAKALDVFSKHILMVGHSYSSATSEAQQNAQRFSSYQRDVRADLGDYVTIIKQNIPVSTLAADCDLLTDAISIAVIANYHGSSRTNATGISVYLPTTANYNVYGVDGYQQLSLARDTAWNEWLAGQP